MLRSVLRFLVRGFFRTLTRFEVQGLNHIPGHGGMVLAVNHLSRFDPPALFAVIKRRDLTALVADKYKSYPIIVLVVKIVGGIWIHREDTDFRALRDATEYLHNGGLLGIAPEGTRSSQGLIAAKTGVAYLADKAGVPVIPVAVSGTDRIFQTWARLRRPRVSVRIGEPFCLPPLERKNRAAPLELKSRGAQLQENTDQIMLRIAAMLPEEYRGVYAGDPRLEAYLSKP